MSVTVERLLASLLDPGDAAEREVDRLSRQFDPAFQFDEAWRGSIEHDWQQQRWSTFKDMARDIFEHGFRVALYCVVDPDGAFPVGATDGPAGAEKTCMKGCTRYDTRE